MMEENRAEQLFFLWEKNSEGELKSVGHLDSASNSDDSDEGDDKGNGSLLSVAPKPSKLPSNSSPVMKVP